MQVKTNKLPASKRASLAKKITDEKEMLDLYYDNFQAPRVQASLFDNPNLTDNVLSRILLDLRNTVQSEDIKKTARIVPGYNKFTEFLSPEVTRIMYLIDSISMKKWLPKNRVMEVLDISNILTLAIPKNAYVTGITYVSQLGACTYFHIVIYNEVLSDLEKIDLIQDITNERVQIDPLREETNFRDYLDVSSPYAPGFRVLQFTGLRKNNAKYRHRQGLIIDEYKQSPSTKQRIQKCILECKQEYSPTFDEECDQVLEFFK